jgi:hypothetical protein
VFLLRNYFAYLQIAFALSKFILWKNLLRTYDIFSVRAAIRVIMGTELKIHGTSYK